MDEREQELLKQIDDLLAQLKIEKRRRYMREYYKKKKKEGTYGKKYVKHKSIPFIKTNGKIIVRFD